MFEACKLNTNKVMRKRVDSGTQGVVPSCGLTLSLCPGLSRGKSIEEHEVIMRLNGVLGELKILLLSQGTSFQAAWGMRNSGCIPHLLPLFHISIEHISHENTEKLQHY